MIRLALRGDDAGVTRGANDALLACARFGLVRNIGFMVCAPVFEHAAELFREPPPGVVLGLHATVTSEWAGLRWGPVLPASRVPTLVEPDGTFVRDTKTLHERANHDEIIAEVRAQIRRARAHGLRLTYLDTHMVFNWLPGMQGRLNALATEEGLVPDHACDERIHPRLPKPATPAPAGDLLADLRARLDAATPGRSYVQFFHPMRADADSLGMHFAGAADPGAVGRARAAETDLLTSPATAQLLRERGVELVTYAELAPPLA